MLSSLRASSAFLAESESRRSSLYFSMYLISVIISRPSLSCSLRFLLNLADRTAKYKNSAASGIDNTPKTVLSNTTASIIAPKAAAADTVHSPRFILSLFRKGPAPLSRACETSFWAISISREVSSTFSWILLISCLSCSASLSSV